MIQFPSLDDLWSFRIEALIDYIEMDKEKCTLTCRCTQKDLELAIGKYRAGVLVGELNVP